MVRDYWDMWDYTPAPAIKVEGGIKAASARGAFASQWWGKRWIEALERSPSGARLKRGRTYARSGQVVSLHIEHGAVEATVQGSRVKPYRVDIHLPGFDQPTWARIAAAMARQPLMAAQLLQGHMPEEIESLFAEAGLKLLPVRLGDLQTRCSCPDSANPCKHIAAVCYLLAEALDQDPFIMFKLRGIEREAFVAQLVLNTGEEGDALNARSHTGPGPEQLAMEPYSVQPPPVKKERKHKETKKVVEPLPVKNVRKHIEAEQPMVPQAVESLPAEPLPIEPDQFWRGQEMQLPEAGMAHIPATHARWPKRLGTLPLWRSERSFIKTMEEYYGGTSRCAEELGAKLCGDE